MPCACVCFSLASDAQRNLNVVNYRNCRNEFSIALNLFWAAGLT
jgi:hypothetical protein